MAGRFKALTCAQEPRCSRHDRPDLAACPQGLLSPVMAVPHSDSKRRKAAASLVLALLAASKALMDTPAGAGKGGLGAAGIGAGAAVACAAPCDRLPPAGCSGEI